MKKIIRILKDEQWYFSVIDVIFVLTDIVKPRDYWYKLRQRSSEKEQIELSTICRCFKLIASDGKMILTDCANTKGILRIIQSIL